jgi:phosphoserine phosphatase RsbU/P
MARLNNLLCERSCCGMFVTLCYIVLELSKGSLSYVNAGHIPPFLWNARDSDRNVRMLRQGGGPPTGIAPGLVYQAGECTLKGGDRLLMTTDGLTEAMNDAGERFGIPRLETVLREADSSCWEARETVLRAAEEFVGKTPQADDLTFVLIGCDESA